MKYVARKVHYFIFQQRYVPQFFLEVNIWHHSDYCMAYRVELSFFQCMKNEVVKSIWTCILCSFFYRWEMWIWLEHCYLQTLTLEFIMKLVSVGTFN